MQVFFIAAIQTVGEGARDFACPLMSGHPRIAALGRLEPERDGASDGVEAGLRSEAPAW